MRRLPSYLTLLRRRGARDPLATSWHISGVAVAYPQYMRLGLLQLSTWNRLRGALSLRMLCACSSESAVRAATCASSKCGTCPSLVVDIGPAAGACDICDISETRQPTMPDTRLRLACLGKESAKPPSVTNKACVDCYRPVRILLLVWVENPEKTPERLVPPTRIPGVST